VDPSMSAPPTSAASSVGDNMFSRRLLSVAWAAAEQEREGQSLWGTNGLRVWGRGRRGSSVRQESLKTISVARRVVNGSTQPGEKRENAMDRR
jgi:hypothetical protein